MSEFLAAIQRLFGQVIFWAVVEPWEQAIRVRAGRHVKRLHSGFHWRIPVIDQVHKQSVRLRTSLLPTQTLSTADGATLVVGASLGYAIRDIEALYRGLHHAEDTIVGIAASGLAAIIVETPRALLDAGLVGEAATKRLAEELAPFGFEGVEVRITDFAFIRAFRLIRDGRWSNSKALNTEAAP